MSDKVANLLLKQLIRHNILYRGSLELTSLVLVAEVLSSTVATASLLMTRRKHNC